MSNFQPSHPRGVTILGYLFSIGGILAIVVGILGIGPLLDLSIPKTYKIDGTMTIPVGVPADTPAWVRIIFGEIYILTLGPLYFKVGRDLLKLRQGARKTALVLVIIGLSIDIIDTIVEALLDPSQAWKHIAYFAIRLALYIIIIAYLQKPSIKQYFTSSPLLPPPS